jgi:hypothetical protein
MRPSALATYWSQPTPSPTVRICSGCRRSSVMQAPRNCFAEQPAQSLRRVTPQRPCLKAATLTALSLNRGKRLGTPAQNSKPSCEVEFRRCHRTPVRTSLGNWDGPVRELGSNAADPLRHVIVALMRIAWALSLPQMRRQVANQERGPEPPLRGHTVCRHRPACAARAGTRGPLQCHTRLRRGLRQRVVVHASSQRLAPVQSTHQ